MATDPTRRKADNITAPTFWSAGAAAEVDFGLAPPLLPVTIGAAKRLGHCGEAKTVP